MQWICLSVKVYERILPVVHCLKKKKSQYIAISNSKFLKIAIYIDSTPGYCARIDSGGRRIVPALLISHPDLALSKFSAPHEALTFSLLTFTPLLRLISVWLASVCCFPSATIECNWKGVRFGPSGCINSHYHIRVFLWIVPHTQSFVGNCLWLHRAGERLNPFEMFLLQKICVKTQHMVCFVLFYRCLQDGSWLRGEWREVQGD